MKNAIYNIDKKEALALIEEIRNYDESDFNLFNDEYGWQDWMSDFIKDDENKNDPEYILNEEELAEIEEVQRAAWHIAFRPVELAEFKGEEINDTIWMVEDDAGTDVWHTVCSSMDEANDEAERQWNHLTKSEKRQRSVRVIFTKLTEQFYDIEDLALYGTEDWDPNAFHSSDSTDECFNSEFISKLYTLRREANLTQQELADEADVHITTISRIERGDRGSDKLTLDTAARLAEALGCHAEDLLD